MLERTVIAAGSHQHRAAFHLASALQQRAGSPLPVAAQWAATGDTSVPQVAPSGSAVACSSRERCARRPTKRMVAAVGVMVVGVGGVVQAGAAVSGVGEWQSEWVGCV